MKAIRFFFATPIFILALALGVLAILIEGNQS